MFSSRTIIQHLYYCSAYIQPPVMPRHEASAVTGVSICKIWNATATYFLFNLHEAGSKGQFNY